MNEEKNRPMYWSVRRELWENRSLYLAPLAVAAVTVFGYLLRTIAGMWTTAASATPPEKLAMPYDIAAALVMVTTLIVAIFYCLDALQGERRDRSILFWKSLPVSDVTAVMSKACIPIILLPLITFAVTIVTYAMLLPLNSVLLLRSGHSPAALLTMPWGEMTGMLLYHLITVHGLYYAPIFCWLLLVSAWARRMAFLWAFIPLAAVGIIEKIAFNTSYFGSMLANRMSGGMEMGKGAPQGTSMLGPFAPLQFVTSPGLWIGFAVAALFLAIAVRLRRSRGPV